MASTVAVTVRPESNAYPRQQLALVMSLPLERAWSVVPVEEERHRGKAGFMDQWACIGGEAA